MTRETATDDKYFHLRVFMNYEHVYNSIMLNAKKQNRCKNPEIYYEIHHILPNFLFKDRKDRGGPSGHLVGNPDDDANLVLLTAREHFLAHLLLVKIYKDTRYECSAKKSLVWFFTLLDDTKSYRNSWLMESKTKRYERYKRLAIEGIRDSMKGMMLVKDSLTGEKIGRVSVTHENVLSKKWVHWSQGRVPSKHEREQLSKRVSGELNPNAKTEVTKDIILERLFKYIADNNLSGKHISAKQIVVFIQDILSVSITLIRSRFGGKFSSLIDDINVILVDKGFDMVMYSPYYRSPDQRAKLSSAASEYGWVTDGVVNRQVKKEQIGAFLVTNKQFRKGRSV